MNDVSVVGGKAKGLAKLLSYGCPVPDFFVVTAGTALNGDCAAEILSFAADLHCEAFSVRSSNVHEDGAANSFAGQYLTLLNVKKEELFAAVSKVAQSALGQSADKYAGHFAVAKSQMAVIVQKQITGTRSGVLFTVSPSSAEEMLIECVEGEGESLVSGAVTPEKITIKKNEGRREDQYISELVDIASELEKREGRPLDVEWTIADKLYILQMRPITVLGDALPEIAKSNWNFYVYRDFCTLAHSVQISACERSLQRRLFGFDIPVYEGLLVNGREFYSDENDELTAKKWAECDKGGFFEEFIARIEKLVQSTKRLAASLKNRRFDGCGKQALFAQYRKAMGAYIQSYTPLMMRPDDYLIGKYRSLGGELTSEIADILTPVWERTAYSEEKEDILRAKINGDIGAYLEKYEWVNNPLGKRAVRMSDKDIQKRLDRLTVEQAKKSLKEIKDSRKRKKIRYERFIEGTDDEEKRRCLKLISAFIHLRTYTAENSDRLFYYVRERLIFAIADVTGIAHEDILCMTHSEIAALERGERVDKIALAKRRSGEMITFYNGEINCYYGNTVGALLSKLLPKSDDDGKGILFGEIACAGEVKGVVKIVRSFAEAEKVEEGDIVVTSMTTPEIVAALEKAGGIITDEGGITCHAAIIAREYGIPCLVGTKCATGELSDGMNIFLDCVNGRVERIDG